VDSGTTIVSKKYATAFLNILGLRLVPIDFEHADAAMRYLFNNQHALGLLKIPGIDTASKQKVLYKFAEKFKLSEPFKQLIDLLLEHKRAFLLPNVLEMVGFINQQRRGIDHFEISSSHPLEKSHIVALEQFLIKKTGQAVHSTYTLDKTLIAGIRLQSSTLLWEYSVRKQLKMLQPH